MQEYYFIISRIIEQSSSFLIMTTSKQKYLCFPVTITILPTHNNIFSLISCTQLEKNNKSENIKITAFADHGENSGKNIFAFL